VRRVGCRKNLVWMLIAALLFSMTMVGVGTSSPEPIVYVDPQVNSTQPSETFTASIKARDVEDLFLSHVEVAFDPRILSVVDDPATPDIEGINPGDQPNSLEVVYYEQVVEEVTPQGVWGMIKVVSGRPVGVHEGLSGTVGLAKITFQAETYGKSILKLYFSDLVDVDGNHIEHYDEDGFFSNANPVLWIKKKGAQGVGVKPEWHNAPVGTTNTLYATVVNTGVEDANVRVVFVITGPVETVKKTSEEQTIAPGEKVTFSVTQRASDPGDYTFYAFIEYEIRTWLWKNWKLECQEAYDGEGYTYDKGTGWFRAN